LKKSHLSEAEWQPYSSIAAQSQPDPDVTVVYSISHYVLLNILGVVGVARVPTYEVIPIGSLMVVCW